MWEVPIFICIFLITHGYLLVTHQHTPQWLSRIRADLHVEHFQFRVVLQNCPEVLVLCEEEEHDSLCLIFVCVCTYNFCIQTAQNRRNGGSSWTNSNSPCLWQIHVLSHVTHGHLIKLWEYKTQRQKPPSKWLRLFCSLSSDAWRWHFLQKDLDFPGAS